MYLAIYLVQHGLVYVQAVIFALLYTELDDFCVSRKQNIVIMIINFSCATASRLTYLLCASLHVCFILRSLQTNLEEVPSLYVCPNTVLIY